MKQDIARQILVGSAARERAVGAFVNRMFDTSIAIAVLVLAGPLMLLTALAIRLEGGGPVIFSHQRIGQGGRLFSVFKFRTMAVGSADLLARHLESHPDARVEWEADHKLKSDPRVTRLGRFLRSSSLDELPQLFNVLRGEMSIVGPRPITLEEVTRYGDHFASYCSIRPGITGVWQVSGRNDISYQRRVEMDALYARRKSMLLDLSLVVATIPAVLLRRGSY